MTPLKKLDPESLNKSIGAISRCLESVTNITNLYTNLYKENVKNIKESF